MDVNLTLWGWFAAIYILVMTMLSFYLGKKKTDMPIIATFIGAGFSLIPPLGLIYLAVLLLKKDQHN
tara:strand:- start:513 stop:713 length:201 start_codon:yes stop_codon:yes gene_type:complete